MTAATNIRPRRARKRLAALQLLASAGVDHGANAAQMGGAEGWIVMKAKRKANVPAFVPDPPPVTPPCATCLGKGWTIDPATATAVMCPDCRTSSDLMQAAKASAAAWARPLAASATKAGAWGAIEAEATELQKSAVAKGQKMTREQAIANVTELRPELVAAWRAASPDVVKAASPVAPSGRPNIAIATLEREVSALSAADGITKSAAYERILATPHGLALRALDHHLAGRTAARDRIAETVAKADNWVAKSAG